MTSLLAGMDIPYIFKGMLSFGFVNIQDGFLPPFPVYPEWKLRNSAARSPKSSMLP
jgi:hypothetical protein